jgi:RNA polymerase sigma factor (sigma-70 family)
MSIVHPFPPSEPAAFDCAQAGCRVCQEGLMRQHEALVHFILRQRVHGDVPYEDLLQEGLIALWQAILHFDPQRGIAFSTYAGAAIQNQGVVQKQLRTFTIQSR